MAERIAGKVGLRCIHPIPGEDKEGEDYRRHLDSYLGQKDFPFAGGTYGGSSGLWRRGPLATLTNNVKRV